MPFSVGVDAYNLRVDHRGMGRYARTVLRDWQHEPDLRVTLIARNERDAAVLREEFDHAVTTKVTGYDAVWLPWGGMRFDPKTHTVFTLHDPFPFTMPHANLVARWREQAPIRRGIKRATVLACNSHWTARESARVFGIAEERFTVIPPVPSVFWKPVETPPQDPYVLVVAGPDKRKNLAMLFAAFARAFPERSVTLKIAGNLSEDDAFELRTARFRFERLTPSDDDLRALYSGATAVAVPSTAEGYGIMAVEAMACGSPVLSSNATALPEACDDAAVLLPPQDAGLWSNALARIVSDAALRDDLRARSLARVARIDRSGPARETLRLLRKVT